MPTISTFYGIVIQMFWNDHPPPHFHAVYAEGEAKIDVRTLEVTEGWLPRRALALVLEWAQEHRNELLDCARAISQYARFLRCRNQRKSIPHVMACCGRSAARRISTLGSLSRRDGRLRRSFRVDWIAPRRAFAKLADPSLFAQVFVEQGVVTWPGELDLAPDAMYAEIKKSGKWMLA